MAAFGLLAGCGGDGGPALPERPRETADEPASLPEGWRRHVNHLGGYSLGLPLRWTARRTGPVSLLRSPDRLVAMTVSADRTTEALQIELERYATDALAGLQGFQGLEPSEPRQVRSPYEAIAVDAIGRNERGIRQLLTFVVVRREGIAAYPILIARNADAGADHRRHEFNAIVASLRGQPIDTSPDD